MIERIKSEISRRIKYYDVSVRTTNVFKPTREELKDLLSFIESLERERMGKTFFTMKNANIVSLEGGCCPFVIKLECRTQDVFGDIIEADHLNVTIEYDKYDKGRDRKAKIRSGTK